MGPPRSRQKDPNTGVGLTALTGQEATFASVRAAPSDEEEAAVVDAWLRLPPSVDGMTEEEVYHENAGADRVVDKSFPPSNASLYRDPSDPPPSAPAAVHWTSVGGSLYVHSLRSGDVVQGQLGDCWFLGALSIVASRQDLLLDLIVSDELGQAGLFTFRFYKNGQWHDIVVDDMLPCHPGTIDPLFARSAQPGELWPSLIEKAYSKLHGSYFALDGGNCTEAMVDLTGGAGMRIKLTDPKYEMEMQTGKLWARLKRYNDWGYLMGCAFSDRSQPEGGRGPDGILSSHAYSLLDMQETSNGHKLLRLRNPWGDKEWRGPWSDGSREWHLPENSHLQSELEYQFVDDGTFWIEYSDFVNEFNKLFICRLFPPSWHQLTIKGAWVGKTAGGAPFQKGRMSSAWCNNPQYHLTVTRSCEMVISLMQRDSRIAFGQRLPAHERHLLIGLSVLRVQRDFRGRLWVRHDQQVVKETELSSAREVTLSVSLDANTSYMVVPYTAVPEQEGPFILRTFSSAPVEVERPPPAHEVSLQGQWTLPTSGGRSPGPMFGSNPQFVLEVPRKTSAMIVLQRADTGDKVGVVEPEENPDLAIGVSVVQAGRDKDGAVCRKLVIENDKEIYAESDFYQMQEAMLFITLVPETPYLVVPSSSAPGLVAPFTLTVYSSTDMVLAAFRDSQSIALPGAWDAATAGGCDLYDTWNKNPKFVLSIQEKGVYRVALSRPGKKWTRNMPLDHMLGIYVLRSENASGAVAIEKKLTVAETAFLPMTEVVEELELMPTDDTACFVIIPCTYAPGKLADFLVSVTSECPFTLEEI